MVRVRRVCLRRGYVRIREGEREGEVSVSMIGCWVIDISKRYSSTYGHRLLKTRLPVRSAKDKPQIG